MKNIKFNLAILTGGAIIGALVSEKDKRIEGAFNGVLFAGLALIFSQITTQPEPQQETIDAEFEIID